MQYSYSSYLGTFTNTQYLNSELRLTTVNSIPNPSGSYVSEAISLANPKLYSLKMLWSRSDTIDVATSNLKNYSTMSYRLSFDNGSTWGSWVTPAVTSVQTGTKDANTSYDTETYNTTAIVSEINSSLDCSRFAIQFKFDFVDGSQSTRFYNCVQNISLLYFNSPDAVMNSPITTLSTAAIKPLRVKIIININPLVVNSSTNAKEPFIDIPNGDKIVTVTSILNNLNAIAPTLSIVTDKTIQVTATSMNVSGIVPTASASKNINIAATIAASVNTSSIVPIISANKTVNITATIAASVNTSGIVPTVIANRSINLAATIASSVNTSSIVPTITSSKNINIAAIAASVNTASIIPTVTASRSINVAATIATASDSAIGSIVAASKVINITSVNATANTSSINPAVTTTKAVIINADPMVESIQATSPVSILQGYSRIIVAVRATAYSEAYQAVANFIRKVIGEIIAVYPISYSIAGIYSKNLYVTCDYKKDFIINNVCSRNISIQRIYQKTYDVASVCIKTANVTITVGR